MKDIRIGVFGARRGLHIAQTFMYTNAKIVALCDFNADRREVASKTLGEDVAVYSDFDSFIEHDMDAVIVANYFH